jgi:hypothetical protein
MVEITVHVLEEQVDALAARIAAVERLVERVAQGQPPQPDANHPSVLEGDRVAADLARMSHRNHRQRQVDAIVAANKRHGDGVSAAEAVDRLRDRLSVLERTVGVPPGA